MHQDGTRLVDGAGAPVVLKGVNLGGWLLWEGWIWGAGWNDHGQRRIVEKLGEIVGTDEAADFVARVQVEFITEADIAAVARFGFNTVRVPINHSLLEEDESPFARKEGGFEILDRLLDFCDAHGIGAVLDLHAAPGGQSGWFMADPDPTRLWDSSEAQDRTVALWRAIAARYAHRRAVVGYDLLNEPDPPDKAALQALYRRIAAAIREVDPGHLIILEGASQARDFSMFTAPVAVNQAYSFHMYTWFGDWRTDELAEYHRLSEAHGTPMWVGEFGENSVGMISSTTALYGDARYALGGYAFWTWKKVPNGTDALVAMTGDLSHWKPLVSWITGGWVGQPSAAEARAGMEEFLTAARFENCTVNADMVTALQGVR